MYPQRFSLSMFNHHNLNLAPKKNQHITKCPFMFRRNYSSKNVKNLDQRVREFFKNGGFDQMFSKSFRNQKKEVLKVWMHHCECVMVHRLRRFQQMFCLYSKWWEEKALNEFLGNMKRSLLKNSKEFTLSLAGISIYNWDQNRIPDEEIKRNISEFEYVKLLKENTVCLTCDKKTNINTRICKCGTKGEADQTKTYENWAPFIEKNDLVVWRRLREPGVFEYKVFGSYNDVSAEDFLSVQIDTDYRKKWDNTAVMLEVAETDPASDSNSDILYWEMLWPRLFVNRDYVFNRRYVIDKETNTLFIMSKTTEHPEYPKCPEKYRIEDYWSCMVIKPYGDMKKLGLEFVLTYYDNPGVNIPQSITTWVAMRAMPDFLGRLREATKKYGEYCLREGVSSACKIKAEEERAAREQAEKDKLDYCSFRRNDVEINLPAFYPRPELTKFILGTHNGEGNHDNLSPDVILTSPSAREREQSGRTSFWKYFHPMYYFS